MITRIPRKRFNVLVDLCGIFKKTSIYEVRDLIKSLLPDRFKYVAITDPAPITRINLYEGMSTTSTSPTAATACCMSTLIMVRFFLFA